MPAIRSRSKSSTVPVCDVFALNEAALRRARKRALDAEGAARLAAAFRILGNPTRVRMLDALGRSELCVCDLAVLLDARISAVSHQLALLRRHHLVRWRRAGKLVYYALDDHHVRTLLAQARAHAGHADGTGRKTTPSRTVSRGSNARPVNRRRSRR